MFEIEKHKLNNNIKNINHTLGRISNSMDINKLLPKLCTLVVLIFMTFSTIAYQNLATNSHNLSPTEIHQAITNIANELEYTYIYPDKAKQLTEQLRSKLTLNKYHKDYDTLQFKRDIRALIVELTGDKNFEIVEHNSFQLSKTDVSEANFEQPITVKVLNNNIGYIQIAGALTNLEDKELVKSAMAQLANTSALIIDLRSAEQTTLALTQLFISYFIPNNTHIGNAHLNEETIALLTTETQEFDKFKQDFPVYIVNSAFISGPWEFFSYTLKSFDKALLIGNDTMGHQYLTKQVKISDSLSLRVPYATITSPISNDTWQFGVSADVYQRSKNALEKAFQLAREHLEAQ